ncbi:MAG: hypothetical protein ACK4G4_08480 [Thermus sp.]|uniref:hypothetical protein n=1 Tax=Thermus sp. TaxID=275 RepID=UPI00391B8D27
MRAHWFGRVDGRTFSKKDASLAYLTAPQFVQELAKRYLAAMESLVYRYQRLRGRLEEQLARVALQRQELEKLVSTQEATPEVFAHMWTEWGRRGLLGLVFAAEMVYNKLAMDTLELSQMEAYIVSFIATLAVFWLSHEAGNQLRQGKAFLSGLMLALPLLMTFSFAGLRFEFTRRMAEINGDPPPVLWALFALLLLGLGLIAFTYFLGYRTPHAVEILMRRYHGLKLREEFLKRRLNNLHLRTQRHLNFLLARYQEETTAYWRGFTRAWPRWDPAPEFVGALPPLEAPRLPPLEATPAPLTSPSPLS